MAGKNGSILVLLICSFIVISSAGRKQKVLEKLREVRRVVAIISESLYESFLNIHVLVKREQELYKS